MPREDLGDASAKATQKQLCESMDTCEIDDLIACVDGEVKSEKKAEKARSRIMMRSKLKKTERRDKDAGKTLRQSQKHMSIF